MDLQVQPHSSAGAWRVNQSVNASSFTPKWLGTVKIPHIPIISTLGCLYRNPLSSGTQRVSHLECVLYPRPVHARWMFLEFQGVSGYRQSGIPPRTTGNTTHSCYSRYKPFFHFDIWAGKKVRIHSGYFLGCLKLPVWYPNMRIERSVCAGHLWAAGVQAACVILCAQNQCPGSPRPGECGYTLGPTAWTHHITTHRHIFLLETRNTAAPDISFLFQGSRLHCYLIPFRPAHGSTLWLPADDRATAQIFCVMLPDTACAAGIMGLGTHVTLTKGLWKHKASALLSWNISCATLKQQEFCEQPVTAL